MQFYLIKLCFFKKMFKPIFHYNALCDNEDLYYNEQFGYYIDIVPKKYCKWYNISKNKNADAIYSLQKYHFNKISWSYLSANPSATHILEKNIDKIDWMTISCNKNAIHIKRF